MSKRSSASLDPTLDHGPATLIRRGEIVREDRADPDAQTRTVAGTRRRDGLRAMWSRGQIDGAQWTAAERYRDDLEVASGARPGTDNAGVRSTSRHYEPTALQIDAQTRVTGATLAVGLILNNVLVWVVVSRGTVADYAGCRGIGERRAGEMLRTALDHLVGFYTKK